MNNNNNPSMVPKPTDEDSAIVSALSHVIRGGNEVGPSSRVVIDGQPEQELCGECGMRAPHCLGCDLLAPGPGGGEEEKKKYRGVSLSASGNWTAEIMAPGKERKWLGTYKTPEEAARAYDRANIMYRRRAAKTNFPIEEYGPEIEPDQPVVNVEGSQIEDGYDDASTSKS
ncbi:hypothetical protein R6Q59_034761 [Mikania micrantha]|uniref:AP2/ERF domain-containing protein n=1 Tax=Mikania micrantha TaxID=192012 RepID=A0A5N6NGU4_9ASTR|nr:hypothetical protein E3N88_20217 [Mikania micrantha]